MKTIGNFAHKVEEKFRHEMLMAYSSRYRVENGDSIEQYALQAAGEVYPPGLSSVYERKSFRRDLTALIKIGQMRRAA